MINNRYTSYKKRIKWKRRCLVVSLFLSITGLCFLIEIKKRRVPTQENPLSIQSNTTDDVLFVSNIVYNSSHTNKKKMSDRNHNISVKIADIKNYHPVFANETYYSYQANNTNTYINFYINEGISLEGIHNYALQFSNSEDYGNHLIHQEEINGKGMDKEGYRGIKIHYKTGNKDVYQMLLNRQIDETVFLTIEIIQKDTDFQQSDFMFLTKPGIIQLTQTD